MSRYSRIILALLLIGIFVVAFRSGQAVPLETIKLPPGFKISIYAAGVRNAREMALGFGRQTATVVAP
mgnify:CR=1 FL=1